MARKRGNGEGSIIKRSDGTWSSYLPNVPDPITGKVKRKYFYGKTRQEVADKLREAQTKKAKGGIIEPKKITVGDWLDTWLFQYKKSSVRPTTFESYEYLIRAHIKPYFGTMQLGKVRPEQVQAFYNEKVALGRVDNEGGLSPRTVKYIHIILSEAMDQAIKNGLIERNVCKATNLPKGKKKKMRVLTLEEQMRFLKAVSDERLGPAFKLALASGVRIGELLALQWKNVNFENGTIRIEQAIKRVKTFDPNSETKSQLIIQEPKTEAGKRTIPLPQSMIEELKEWRKVQLEERLAAGGSYFEYDLVFCTELGKPIEPRNLTRLFYRMLEKAGLEDVNFHALRHSYATRLLEVNEHPKVVQDILGHSSISITLDTYSHVMPDIKKAAAQKIDYLFQNTKQHQNN